MIINNCGENMKDLIIKIKYRSLEDDILNSFYIPVLSKAKYYYRAVGYFSSSILLEYARGLKNFIRDDGKMKLIISPYLTEDDYKVLKEGKSDMYDYKKKVNEMFESFLSSDYQTIASCQLLYMLIMKDILEIKVAQPKNDKGIFHEKIGIFIDENENMIAISGSNNETGSSVKINNESFNTFCSWIEGQSQYTQSHFNDFMDYWSDKYEHIKLVNLKEALDAEIIKKLETEYEINDLFEIIKEDETYSDYGLGFRPYDYQVEAVEKWLLNNKGIFKFATGAGKTKTSIYLMEKMKKIHKKMIFFIVVPDKTLVNQWFEELIKTNDNVIKCFSDNKNWHSELLDILDIFDMYEKRYNFVISTNDTFFGRKFKSALKSIKDDYMIVVDECHTWGTSRILSDLPNFRYRLGLSATPELHFSVEKTKQLFDYFSGITYEYSLDRAIKDNKLVGYTYNPIIIELNDAEKANYDYITKKIVKLIGHDTQEMADGYDQALEMLLFKRARIIYGAINKIKALELLLDKLVTKKRTLIYCGSSSQNVVSENELEEASLSQLEQVNVLLANKGLQYAKYTSKENEFERNEALKNFKSDTYSILVAIKCLDEGVDIPQIERAIIMASSTNPREFIQRRGRILRPFPGKEYSEIYDFVVLDDDYNSLNQKEIERVYEFCKSSINRVELEEKYESYFQEYINRKVDLNDR
jgi:superfamily II DNA or RNA helicase